MEMKVMNVDKVKGTARERSDIDIAVSGVNDFEKVVKQLEMCSQHGLYCSGGSIPFIFCKNGR